MKKAFTLIELLVALVIVGIIGAAIYPLFFSNLHSSKDKAVELRADLLDNAKIQFMADKGKKLAKSQWAAADTLPSYPSDDNSVSTNPETTVEVYRSNPNKTRGVSQRDEAKYKLLLPYLENATSLLGYGSTDGQYAPQGYMLRLNALEGDTPSGMTSHNVTVKPSSASMGTASGTGSYFHNYPASVGASPNLAGNYIYKFSNWIIDSGSPSPFNVNTPSNTFNVLTDVSLTANFDVDESKYYTFSANAVGGSAGSTPDPTNKPAYNSKWQAGSKFNLTSSPSGSNTFNGWTSTGGGTFANPSSQNTVFTLGSANAIATANYSIPSYTFSIGANAGGGAQIVSSTNPDQGGGKYLAGTVLTIQANPDATHTFKDWTSTGNAPANASTSPTTVTLTQNSSATANFNALKTFTVTLTGIQCSSPGDSSGAGDSCGMGGGFPSTIVITAKQGDTVVIPKVLTPWETCYQFGDPTKVWGGLDNVYYYVSGADAADNGWPYITGYYDECTVTSCYNPNVYVYNIQSNKNIRYDGCELQGGLSYHWYINFMDGWGTPDAVFDRYLLLYMFSTNSVRHDQ